MSACLLLAALVSAAPLSAQESSKRQFKIGFSGPLTGPAASYGLDVWTSLQFAAAELGEGRFRVVGEDDKCDPKEAAAIAHKFISISHVDAVVGPVCSGPAFSAAPLYEKAGVLVMLTNASAQELADAGDFVFRTKPSDLEISRILWNYVSRHCRKLGILSEQTDFASSIKDSMVRFNVPARIELVTEEFLPGTTDFRTNLLRLKAAEIEGLFIMPQTDSLLAVVLKQVKSLGWNVQIYGAHFPQSPTFLAAAGSDADGIIFSATPMPEDILNTRGMELYARYTREYGPMRSIPVLFATTYEGFRALRDALLSADPRRTLYERQWDTIFGALSFDEKGEPRGVAYQLKRIEHGRAVLMKSSQD